MKNDKSVAFQEGFARAAAPRMREQIQAAGLGHMIRGQSDAFVEGVYQACVRTGKIRPYNGTRGDSRDTRTLETVFRYDGGSMQYDKHEQAFRERIRIFDPLARFAATRQDAAIENGRATGETADPQETETYLEKQRAAEFAKTANRWRTSRHNPPEGGRHPRSRSTAPNTGEDHHRLPPTHAAPAFSGGNQGSAAGSFGGAGMGDDGDDDEHAKAQDAMFARQKDAYKQPSRRDLRRGIAR